MKLFSISLNRIKLFSIVSIRIRLFRVECDLTQRKTTLFLSVRKVGRGWLAKGCISIQCFSREKFSYTDWRAAAKGARLNGSRESVDLFSDLHAATIQGSRD